MLRAALSLLLLAARQLCVLARAPDIGLGVSDASALVQTGAQVRQAALPLAAPAVREAAGGNSSGPGPPQPFLSSFIAGLREPATGPTAVAAATPAADGNGTATATGKLAAVGSLAAVTANDSLAVAANGSLAATANGSLAAAANGSLAAAANGSLDAAANGSLVATANGSLDATANGSIAAAANASLAAAGNVSAKQEIAALATNSSPGANASLKREAVSTTANGPFLSNFVAGLHPAMAGASNASSAGPRREPFLSKFVDGLHALGAPREGSARAASMAEGRLNATAAAAPAVSGAPAA